MINPILPDREAFKSDPGGYSRLAWIRWAILSEANGGGGDPTKPPTSADLKCPVLWLTQAEAMTQAAITLVRNEPAFENMPKEVRGICDSQYCAVALMLVGYSLEVCLKAMIIIRDGVDAYIEAEKKYLHHRLHDLATFIDGMTEKDLAILKLLTNFVSWAGRYPDPGMKYIAKHEEIFELSEQHQISAADVFRLAASVTGQVRKLATIM